jgi:hypothetical protein
MTPKIIVRLKITSEVHPPEFISEVLGVMCDKGWQIGEQRSKTIIKESVHGWILGSGLEKSASLEEQVKALLQRIGPIREKMRASLAGDNLEISCVIYSESPPALNFDSRLISEMADFGASLDIDLYIG